MGKVKQILKNLPGLKDISFRLKECDERLIYLEEQNKINSININILQNEINTLSKKLLTSNGKDRLAIYTVIIGNYDFLREPEFIDEYCDYFCFTNLKTITSKTWNIVYLDINGNKETKNIDDVRFSRYVKTHPHKYLPNYKHSLYIDANLKITNSVYDWIYSSIKTNNCNWLTFKHPDRDCIYDEATECIKLNKDREDIINKHVEKLKDEGYPVNNGLTMNNVIYRKNNKLVNDINEQWWKEIKNNSKRDQLSLLYIFWKNNFHYEICSLDAVTNKFFDYASHLGNNEYEYSKSLCTSNNIEFGLKKWYENKTGKTLDLDNPKTFNEKINWLKVHDNNLEKTIYTDKFEAKLIIGELIGEKYVIPTIGVYDKFDQIDFNILPKKFVIKVNNGSGRNIIIKDKSKLNKNLIRKQIGYWLTSNYAYVNGFEMNYEKITPKIIIEEYTNIKYDYKIHCFNGEPLIIQVIGNRDYEHYTAKQYFFNTHWKKTHPVCNTFDEYNLPPKKPNNLNEMLEIAKKLSKSFKYVRVDLYDIKGKVYFGEMTFYPQSGIGKWNDENENIYVGSLIKID